MIDLSKIRQDCGGSNTGNIIDFASAAAKIKNTGRH